MTAGRGFQTKTNVVPRLRDVVMLDFSPHRGKEPPDTHPGVVMSEQAFNHLGLCLVVPITHSLLGNKLAVEIPASRNLGFEGFIHPDRIRSVDHGQRIVGDKLGVLPDDLYNEVLSRLATLIDPLQRVFRQA
jgi:mRNA-degrading endonuclease toxin of MazEF toxin-antitoxin module